MIPGHNSDYHWVSYCIWWTASSVWIWITIRLFVKIILLTMVETLESLRFTINYKKSFFIPTQQNLFFGFVIDTVEFKIFLTQEKVKKILLKAKYLLKNGTVVVRELASFIGLIINAFYADFEAPLHYNGEKQAWRLRKGYEFWQWGSFVRN